MNIMFHRQHPDQKTTCSTDKFSTENIKVLNENRLPFFLPGMSLAIISYPGYGKKALRFTLQQEMLCGSEHFPRRCSRITRKSKVAKLVSLNWQEYLVTEIAVIVAFAVIVGAPLFAAACSVYRLLCKKKVEENAEVDVQKQNVEADVKTQNAGL